MSAAQVYDWLEEKYQVKNVSESTVRAYVIYDQDALLVVSENGGDLILTKDFQRYLDRSPNEMNDWVEQLQSRKKKLDYHKDRILSWLNS